MLARLTLLLALSSLASQSDTPQETPVFRTEVNLIEVDVHVEDRDGNFVDDLKPTDFEIFEDGVLQKVAAFRLVDLPVRPRPKPLSEPDAALVTSDVVTNEGTAEGHVYALVLDDLHTRPARTTRVREVARQFIEQWLGENDLAAVTTTGGVSEASSYFTSNRQALLDVVEKFSGRQLRSITLEQIELREEYLLGLVQPETLSVRLRTLDQEHAFRAQTALSHLRSMSEILGNIEGRRKVILYIGEGVPYNMEDFARGESAETVAIDTRRALGSAGLSNVSFYTLDVRGRSDGQEDLVSISRVSSGTPLNQVAREREMQGQGALSTRVAGEQARQGERALDPRVKMQLEAVEVESQAFANEARRQHDYLRVLAEETGGLAAVNQNDLEQGLHRLVTDNRRFYQLGYTPPNVRADGRFRKIEVRVKGQDLRVRARKGYIVPKEEDRLADIAEADGLDPEIVRDLLNRHSPVTGIPLRVFAFPFRLGEKTAAVAVVVESDIHAFRFTEKDGRFHDKVTVSAIVLDDQGTWVTGQTNKFDLTLRPPARERMRHDGFRAASVLDVPSGSHQLRVGVWEEGAGQKGTVYTHLRIPDFTETELAMGGILLSSKLEESVMVASTTEVRQAIPFLPSTRRNFTPGDEVFAAVQIFRNPTLSKDQEVVLDTSVRDEQGKTVFEFRESPAAPSGAPWIARSQIDLSRYSPGPYVIEVQARDPDGVILARKRNLFHVMDAPSMADLPLPANYVGLLRSYCSGHLDEARNQLATWTDDNVKRVAGQLRSGASEPRTLQAAVLLHTELSAYNRWGLPAETRALHLQTAEAFVKLLPGGKAFDHDWLLTVTYIYHGSNLSVSLNYLKEARRRFPNDAEILLATGVTYETAAARNRIMLKDAEKYYRRSIKADSVQAEAHLRLGRVLLEQGGKKTEEAIRELEWVVSHSSDPYLLYLANLFLGDLHKSRDDFMAAVTFYRAAVTSEPRWQVAHLSLSHALRASGNRSEARDVMQEALRLPVHDASYIDGYRLYFLGQLIKVPELLDKLRQGIME